ncbi:putative extracellular nuclease/2',3'-cyclic-nucleotide 2'-phosphodiesterase (5'-nucleotidase family) [Constrictibacter sp. MBR-5]|jgi:predicted extracellular nuclease/2',3'-cyclic-nucleotide 2'-phosphodiesterase (5'-nucleotidase family)|uniref:choice-of-anchor I family protein n=1 Tax=Constrictibacter sp. MBR-5 TaxID=3156467 RepID=UPI003396BF20
MSITLTHTGRYATGIFDESAAEIVAHDPVTQRLFVVNGSARTIDVLQMNGAGDPVLLTQIEVGHVNSVAVSNGVVAAAVQSEEDDGRGRVVLMDTDGALLGEVEVGVLPDALTFSPDGMKIVVSNEGEFTDEVDPQGSISIVDLSAGPDSATVVEVDFSVFDGQEDALREKGVRLFPGKTASQSLEPEYAAISADGTRAMVTLQENNAVAIIDLETAEIVDIVGLGLKDHSLEGQGLDPSDRDGGVNIAQVPVFGMYMPDGIASFESGGQTYFVIANEGDARGEEVRIEDLDLDPTVYPNAEALQQDETLGRLEASSTDGDIDDDGDIDQIHVYGGRSFSILNGDGMVVFDSGDDFEQILAAQLPEAFNANNDDNDSIDSRSDAKGPEPEGVTIGVIGPETYAFIGLERAGGVMVYRISDPTAPEFVQYINNRDFTVDAESAAAGDLGPEGLAFISADDSPTGKPMLVTGNEVSGTTSVFEIDVTPTISEIQGAGHQSGYAGMTVTTGGIVTALESNGFYLQDPTGDGDVATSDAVFVFTGSGNVTTAVGDAVTLTGTVQEYFPGGAATGNLSTTQIGALTDLSIDSRGNALPEAAIIGDGGRVPPTEVIDDDGLAVFDPGNDGIDFYESLEGMRVTVNDAVAVSATNRFGEIFALADEGEGATGRNDRGGITLAPDDANPERIQIQFDDDVLRNFDQTVDVGARLGDVTGVVDYNFGNFEVKVTQAFPILAPSALERETTALTPTENGLTIATYNVLNLSPQDTAQLAALGAQIATNLGGPDIIGLQEIQDASGEVDDGTVSGAATLQALADAIAAAGGPTYAFAEVAPADGASGGVPGGNIRNAFLYNADRVDLVEGSVTALGTGEAAFADTRQPLQAQFLFNGETVTVINNHFPSKSGSTPLFGTEQPPVDAGADQRLAQAEFLKAHVSALEAADTDAKVVLLGDLNDFQFSQAVQTLQGEGADQVLFDRLDTLEGDATYTYNFEGNSQVLDHMLFNEALRDRAEVDIVHANVDFADQASDHEAIVARVEIEPAASTEYQLQILHASDLEGGVDAIGRAANFAALADLFEDEYANSVTISAGDNYIPGPFFVAAADPSVQSVLNEVYNDLYDTDIFTGLGVGSGRVDVSIMNVIGFDASAFGNHEFDAGTGAVADIIGASGSPDAISWLGAQFPYLSANLDFSGSNLAGLLTDDILSSEAFRADPTDIPGSFVTPKIAPATIIEENGEMIGVVGATTPLLESISSPGAVTVREPGAGTNDMAALAAILQPTIDALRDQGVDKIVLTSHLQQIALEQELAGLLHGVDIILAGGSDTLLADETDVLREGDTADGDYPLVTTDADGNTTLIVSTDGEYSYLGRLVVTFDAEGNVLADSLDETVNGAYASTEAVVAAAWGEADPFAENSKGELVQRLVDAVDEVVTVKDGNVLGLTDVYLDGRRESVRTEETNLGNLSADANLAEARKVDAEVMVSIKNGGGIRAGIGEVDSETGELVAPADGEVSQLDIENALRFNNSLSIVTITAATLLAVMEHAFAGVAPGSTPGAFPQIGGMEVSFDPSAAVGDRIRSLAVVDEDGLPVDVIVENGEVVGDASREIKVVTLGFLADGGDGYPFPDGTLDRIDLGADNLAEGEADFATAGTEQDALAEYMLANHAEVPYAAEETSPEQDERIQNLAVREDTVLEGGDSDPDPDMVLVGGWADDTLVGGSGNDRISGGFGDDNLDGGAGDDVVDGGFGDDVMLGGLGNDRMKGSFGNDDVDGGGGDDVIHGEFGDDVLSGGAGRDMIDGGFGDDRIVGGGGRDTLLGDFGRDVVSGGGGDDRIQGGFGDDRLAGNAGDDEIDGGFGNDRLAGGEGDDVLEGGFGNDTFVFETSFGLDRVMDFGRGRDTIRFEDGLFGDFAAVTASGSQVGSDVLLSFDADNVITLVGVDLASLRSDDFSFA